MGVHNDRVLNWDLQLFAEETPPAPPGEGAAPEDAKGAEGAPQPQPPGTILGGGESPEGGGEKPSVPEKYEIKLPEGAEPDEARLESFSALLKAEGLNNEQAQKFADYGFEFASELSKMAHEDGKALAIKELEEEVAAWGEAAKKQLGGEFAKVSNAALIGVEYLEKQVPGLKEALNLTGAGNHVAFIRALSLVGEMVRDDPGKFGGESGAAPAIMYDKTDFTKY
jgi:hypothetical protein